MEKQIDGVIVLNKPTGMNSMSAVSRVKHILNVKKAGHLGTLDPMASGVLPIAIGKATKLFESHLHDNKIYRAIFKFGIETDTFDSEGKIIKIEDCDITQSQVENILKEMVGTFDQIPPNYSAKKINGKRAYELSRAGQEVVLQPKRITINSFNFISQIDKNVFLFEINCSSGTYVRSICRDLAKALKTVGVMVGLVRLASGQYNIEDSILLDEVTEENIKLLN